MDMEKLAKLITAIGALATPLVTLAIFLLGGHH